MKIHRHSLRLMSATALALAMLAPATAAIAAQPERFSDHRVFVNCALLSGDGADAYFSISTSERFGSSAGIQIWLHPDDIVTQPPTMVSGEASLVLAPDDSSLTGTVELLPGELGIQSVGTATVDVLLAPSGPIQTIENRFGDSNVKQRESDTFRTLAASGTLAISVPGRDDIVLGFDACDGLVSDVTYFATHPDSTVVWNDEQYLLCTYQTDELYVGLHAEAAAGIVGADMIVLSTSGDFSSLESGPVTLDGDSFAATFDLLSNGAGLSELAGTATASAMLTTLDERSFQLRTENGRTRIEVQTLAAAGSIEISLSDGTSISVPLDDTTCHTNYADSERDMSTTPEGRNAQPIGNDTPDGALPIAAGDVVSQHTGGAAFDGEAFSECAFDGPIPLNVAHSAWYAIEGTGQPITLDTGGSGFDTVLGVYTAAAGGLTEVACNDESETDMPHQARLTFDTEAGATYLVQVGGYIDQSGHLLLRVD